MKELSEISWLVDEPTYRADKAYSYSILATFKRGGFNELEHLFDRKETPSLTYGSCVDALITGGQEEFDNNFIVAEFPKISDTLVAIVKDLFREFSVTHNKLIDIPDIEVSMRAKAQDFWAGDKWDKIRAKKVKEEVGCQDYYNLMYLATGKTIISTDTYNDVIRAVNALKDSETTKFYFQADNPFDNIKRYYQLKFKTTISGINYRCMFDEIIVDYNKKTIQPIDLKTSSKKEWDFYKSFVDWSYKQKK